MRPLEGFANGLTADVSHLWNYALSKSTRATYDSALATFLKFLALAYGVPTTPQDSLPIVTEKTLIDFVSYCQNILHLRYDTVKLYLAGIRFHYIKCHNIDILQNNLQLNYILRAIKKRQCNFSRGLRLPITYTVLSDLCTCLSRGLFSAFVDTMLLAVFTTAFYGFLRCGEFTVSPLSTAYPLIADVTFDLDMSKFTLVLRSSKTDTFSKGVSVLIFNTNPLRPVSLMANYLKLRLAAGATTTSPLFPDSQFSSAPLTRNSFISLLKRALSVAGYNDSHFSGHSFRIGACTSGAAAGVQDHLLKVLGRWTSSCYSRYIRTPPASLSNAQQLMSI